MGLRVWLFCWYQHPGCTHHKRLRPYDPTHVIVCSQNICKYPKPTRVSYELSQEAEQKNWQPPPLPAQKGFCGFLKSSSDDIKYTNFYHLSYGIMPVCLEGAREKQE